MFMPQEYCVKSISSTDNKYNSFYNEKNIPEILYRLIRLVQLNRPPLKHNTYFANIQCI